MICNSRTQLFPLFMKRFEELKFLMNMEEDPIRKKERMRTIELFLDKDMEEINLCDTSSDEDETKDHLSEVTKSTVTTKEAPKIRNRLPGIIEK